MCERIGQRGRVHIRRRPRNRDRGFALVGKPFAAPTPPSGQPPSRRDFHDGPPPAFEAPPTLSQLQAYYDETWSDYRLFWLNRRNLAIHFGYWDESTRTHAQSLNRLNA